MGIPKGASPPFSLGKYRIRLYLFRLSLVLGASFFLGGLSSLAPDKETPATPLIAPTSFESELSPTQGIPKALPRSFWVSPVQEFQRLFQVDWRELLAHAMLAQKEEDWQTVSNSLQLLLLKDPSPSLARKIRDRAGYSFWVAVLVNDQSRKVGRALLQRAEMAQRAGQEIAADEEQIVREKIVTMLATDSYLDQFSISEDLARLDKAKIIQWVLDSPAPRWTPERRIRSIVFFVNLGPDALPYLKKYQESPDVKIREIVKLSQEKIRKRAKTAAQQPSQGFYESEPFNSPFILGPQFGSNDGR